MSWDTLEPHIRALATQALTGKQLQAWKMELAGVGTRTAATHLGISRRSYLDRLENTHRRLYNRGIRRRAEGSWYLEEAA